MKGIYLLAGMMFMGLVIMIYSSYRMMNILEDRKVTTSRPQIENPAGPSIMITDPDIQPYLTGSFGGLVLFIVGAIGGVIVIVKAFTRRF